MSNISLYFLHDLPFLQILPQMTPFLAVTGKKLPHIYWRGSYQTFNLPALKDEDKRVSFQPYPSVNSI
jgi:hypothetical protein